MPTKAALASSLRECAVSRSLSEAKVLHRCLAKMGCDGETLLGNLVVHMYGACGSPEEAKFAFDGILERNLFSWNILIAAFQHRLGDAECLFRKMPQRGNVASNAMLTAYAQAGELDRVKMVFDSMEERDAISWNSLINGYNDGGLLQDSRFMFDRMPCYNVVSWNTMMAAFAEEGHVEEAKYLFDTASERSVITWNTMLTAYSSHRQFHFALIVYEKTPGRNVVTENAMLSAYARNGQLPAAREFYDGMTTRDVVSWNTMAAAFATSGRIEDSESLFSKMPRHDAVSWNVMISGYAANGHIGDAERTLTVCPLRDSVSSNPVITAYARTGNVESARGLFDAVSNRRVVAWNAIVIAYTVGGTIQEASIAFQKMPQWDLVSWTLLVEAFALSGHLEDALRTMNEMPQRDVVSWTSIVSALSDSGYVADAVKTFELMPHHNAVACHVMMYAFARSGQVEAAQFVLDSMVELDSTSWFHLMMTYAENDGVERAAVIFDRMPARDVGCWTTMLVAYAQSGDLQRARSLFEDIPERDLVSWNAMIGAYAYSSQEDSDCAMSIELFKSMDLEATSPDGLTFANVLFACSRIGDIQSGKIIHDLAKELYFDSNDVRVGNLLMNMYGESGRFNELRAAFARMVEPDSESWGVLVSVFAQAGHQDDSFLAFCNMDLSGVQPGVATLVTLFDMFAGAVDHVRGRRSFDHICGSPLLQNVHVSTAAVNMFAKCGDLERLSATFQGMQERNVISWNAMLSGFSQAGKGEKTLRFFLDMMLEGEKPTDRTLVSVLAACSHTGLLEQGCRTFASMGTDFGVQTVPFHCACVVDMLVRAGKIGEAKWMMTSNELMLASPDAAWWMSLLAGSLAHGDIAQAEQAATQVVKIEAADSAAAYIMLSKVYTSTT